MRKELNAIEENEIDFDEKIVENIIGAIEGQGMFVLFLLINSSDISLENIGDHSFDHDYEGFSRPKNRCLSPSPIRFREDIDVIHVLFVSEALFALNLNWLYYGCITATQLPPLEGRE
uniref:Uncharacterized protein n=1 Tax=Megaselia scalaris TaxID=36166 RepID=T1GGE3_MEGSC